MRRLIGYRLEYNRLYFRWLEVLMRRRWQDRVVLDPAIHHGDPCIKGTRIPVAILVGSLADGLTFDDILQAYPQLTREDLFAALAYAAEVMRQEIVYPLSA
jgi:uncharacterized protein (DUF433 family)